ncbi:expressed unknown protein [Seminavis robusta]|uniref:Uncharacterized protein n=1 Tax=Seminavis robusta TaxID=568900 RepID=A0A9N8EP69_9STRA|nr:expressed unknown protein [Seminavis robusta]|eukprot:Sro1272_g258241.1  (106) ;mRNA; r:22325-22642
MVYPFEALFLSYQSDVLTGQGRTLINFKDNFKDLLILIPLLPRKARMPPQSRKVQNEHRLIDFTYLKIRTKFADLQKQILEDSFTSSTWLWDEMLSNLHVPVERL